VRKVLLPLSIALTVASGLLVAPVLAPVASASPSTQIVDSPVDEVLDAVVAPDGTLYAVGGFNEAGPATGGIARLSTSTATVDRNFPTVNGYVKEMIADSSGRIYMVGDFVSVAGQPRTGVVRLNADGSLDTTWSPSFGESNVSTSALALNGTTLFVGGSFTQVNGAPHRNLVAIDTVTGEALDWSPDPDNSVAALATDDSYLYVGGSFTAPKSRLASYSLSDLSLRNGWNPAPDCCIETITEANGVIYVGGYFTQIASVARNLIAALDPVTGAATSWDPLIVNQGSSVNVIVADDTLIYIGGNFTTVNNGVARNRVMAVNTDDTGSVTSWNPDIGPSQVVYTLAVTESDVYIGGQFPRVGSTPMPNLARVDKSTGALDASWDPRIATTRGGGSSVYAFTVLESQVIVGGSFTHMNVVERNGAAAFDRNMRLTSWEPDIFGEPYAIGLIGSTAYVVGDFSTVNGYVTRNYAAAFRTDDTGMVTDWDPDLDSYPYDMEISGDIAYLVGDFSTVKDHTNPETRNYAAAFRADDTGTVMPWDPDLDSAAYSIALEGNVAYMAGDFNRMNQSTINAARYTAGAVRTDDTGTVTDWDPDPDSNAYGVAVSNGIAYLVGGFNAVKDNSASVTRNGAAAITTAGAGTVTDWDPDFGGPPYDVEISGGYAYLGGDFGSLNGGAALRDGLAAVSIDDTGMASDAWIPVTLGGFDYGAAEEGGLAISGQRVLVGGSFPMANFNGVDYPGALAALPLIGGTPPPPPPPPAVTYPPSAPLNVAVAAGNSRLTVTWDAPANTGSFPISNYRVKAEPGGQVCLTMDRTCTLAGLTNGREYAVTVEALNGAGWGAASSPVFATPESSAAIQITGTRDDRLIRVTGSSTDLDTGAVLVPWFRFPGQESFTQGAARILVDSSGDFTWQRKAGKRIRVYVATPDDSLRSNAVTIPALQ
jgi:hypothetical protein